MNNITDIARNTIGTIENEEDDCIVPFKLSTEYVKITWSKGDIKLQKYSVSNVEVTAKM